MDVIIEGKITDSEGIDEILRTCAEIKSVNFPILRINDNDSGLQGRVGFSQGGYIIGAKIIPSGEVGYEAVRKLLSVSEGNYAILDPLRKHVSDVNQSLWIKVDKIVPLLPNLPEDPVGLIDPHPNEVQKEKGSQIEIAKSTKAPAEKIIEPEATTGHVTVSAKSPSRKFNLGFWRVFRTAFFVLGFFTVVLSLALYQKQIMSFASKMFGG